MKRIGLFLIVFLGLSVSYPAFAQIAKIVDVQGSVQVKKEAGLDWQRAKPNMYLADESEIKTGADSECTLALDEELDNVLTIKGDSHIKMEDVKGGKVYLPKGRVFSLIDDLAKLEDFQIRTPTAIAGVKGTGEEVKAGVRCTTINCFVGGAYAQGLDRDGNRTFLQDLLEGFGVIVCMGGEAGDVFALGPDDWRDWDDFKGDVDDKRGEDDRDRDRPDRDDLRDLLDERRDNLRDLNLRDRIRDWWYNRKSNGGEYITE